MNNDISLNNNLIKIAVVGPESTGKSTMAKYLSDALATVCVPEYARYYCQNLNRNYTLQDEINMFHGQIALENALIPLAKNNVILLDTTILTVKIWCDQLFGNTPTEVHSEIYARPYDLYLLMNIDLPWEDDVLRDFPHQREHFLEVWKNELNTLQATYVTISGLGDERLNNGLAAVQHSLATGAKDRNS